MKNQTNQLKWGAILSYAQMALGIVVGLLYTPIMIRLLGKSEYGLYNTVASTISMLSVLNLGFNSSYIRYYARYKKNNDEQSIYKLNGLFFIIFCIIGLLCGKCALYCPNGAREVCGKEYTTDEVLKEILKDKAFYSASGGGVTFSGGECMLQIDFLEELLKSCKENGIHTAVDTAGHVPFERFERILPYTDLFLYDVTVTSIKNIQVSATN